MQEREVSMKRKHTRYRLEVEDEERIELAANK